MDSRRGGRFAGGLGVGGILVIVGIIVALFWSLILGIILILVGLIAFGGFAAGKWYSASGDARASAAGVAFRA